MASDSMVSDSISQQVSCKICSDTIDFSRYEFLLESGREILCKTCSNEDRLIGYMSYSHKTAPEIIICSPKNKETIRLMDRANKRSR